jgi:AraC-like DNA-binding protein
VLVYIGRGSRRYDLQPILQGRQQRRFWEFQAVLRGRIGRVDIDKPVCMRSRTLWLTQPGSSHGWTGPRGQAAEVAVFHFRHLPAALEPLVSARGFVSVPLSLSQVETVRHLLREADHHLKQPGPGLMLCSDYVAATLSLLVYESATLHSAPAPDRDWQRVRQALAWYEARLADNPRFDAVAAAVHVAPSHLRRLFHRCLQTSPQHAFDHLRFRRALQMLTDTDTKLSTISDACGFSEVAAFSRAFKNRFGAPPSHFRG